MSKEFICIETQEDGMFYPIDEIVRCKDCSFSDPVGQGTALWCRKDGLSFVREDGYCYKGRKRDE